MGLYSFLNYKVLLGLCYSTSPHASCQIYIYMCSIMSMPSQLHDRGVASCMLCYTWHRYTCNCVINLFVQTPTNNPTSPFSMFTCLHIPDHNNYSINYTLSEWLYFMPEIRSFGFGAIWIEMRFIAKNFLLEKSSLKFRHGFNFVVFIHPRK